MRYIDQFYSGLFPYTCFGTLNFHLQGFFSSYATREEKREKKKKNPEDGTLKFRNTCREIGQNKIGQYSAFFGLIYLIKN
jgi:hypothetical protein